jgi:hypothetical protein
MARNATSMALIAVGSTTIAVQIMFVEVAAMAVVP